MPIDSNPAVAAVGENMWSSLEIGMNKLTGGSMNLKFPDDPPVVFMTQQPIYSYI